MALALHLRSWLRQRQAPRLLGLLLLLGLLARARRWLRRAPAAAATVAPPPPPPPTAKRRVHYTGKTRPCRWAIHGGCMLSGDECWFAHRPEDLRRPNDAVAISEAAHWRGKRVDLGVVEFALFTPETPGTQDVVCNRCTHLGNPFACRKYKPDEVRPGRDKDGWCATEHAELCTAFQEYLAIVLGATNEIEEAKAELAEPLVDIVWNMARARGMAIADTWLVLEPTRRDVRLALESMEARLRRGERLRLLCHCRPHVRCHAEYLKDHLERLELPALPEPPAHPLDPCWPVIEDHLPRCAECGKWNIRALDPGSELSFCALCWVKYADGLKKQSLKNQHPAGLHGSGAQRNGGKGKR